MSSEIKTRRPCNIEKDLKIKFYVLHQTDDLLQISDSSRSLITQKPSHTNPVSCVLPDIPLTTNKGVKTIPNPKAATDVLHRQQGQLSMLCESSFKSCNKSKK